MFSEGVNAIVSSSLTKAIVVNADKLNNMAKDRYTVLRKWLAFETTKLNPISGKIETYSQEEWVYLKQPKFKK